MLDVLGKINLLRSLLFPEKYNRRLIKDLAGLFDVGYRRGGRNVEIGSVHQLPSAPAGSAVEPSSALLDELAAALKLGGGVQFSDPRMRNALYSNTPLEQILFNRGAPTQTLASQLSPPSRY